MKIMTWIIFILLFLIAFIFQILGLMGFIPIFISTPLLFVSIYLMVHAFSHRKRFKGF